MSFPSEILATRLHSLFQGSSKSHGCYVPSPVQTAGKEKGTATTEPGAATPEHWRAHLEGVKGLGGCPLQDDGTCAWGAVDIDVYDGLNHGAAAAQLGRLGIPALVARSRSGGAHVFVFGKASAALYQKRLREIATALGHSKSEIFPKQKEPTASGGNWLNMPYFGAADSARYAVKPDDTAYTLEEFLDAAERSKQDLQWFVTPIGIAPQPAAPNGSRRAKTFTLPNEIPEGRRDTTLASAAGKMRRAGFSADEIEAALRQMNQERCKPPLADTDVARIAASIGKKDPAPIDEDAGLTKGLADAITAKDHFARDIGGRLYHWSSGVYAPTGERVIAKAVKALCDEWAVTKSWTPELANRVSEWIGTDAPDLLERPPLSVLNVRNGLLDVDTRTLNPHSPDHLSPVQIAASYDPAARCPNIERFVADTFPADSQHLAFEIAAWLMLPDASIQKAVLLMGEGANGKSVFLNLLLNFLGRENVSTLSLHRIEADKFAAARLVGKLANIGTDLPTSELASTSLFKALTGGDVVTGERKFESSFEFRPFARLLFSANSAPRSEDSTHGFFRRWLCLQFARTFDESDPSLIPRAVLDAQLSEPGELSGLLNRALDALPAIRSGRFTETDSTRAALDEFRQTTDPMAVWLDRNTISKAEAVVVKEDLRRAYGQFCQEHGRPIMGDVHFTAALKRLRPRVEIAKRRVNRKPTPVYVGIGMVIQDQGDGFSF